MTKTADTYTRYSACNNCKFMGYVTFLKGKTVSETECPECRCQTLICTGDYERKISAATRFNTNNLT
jgi:hypothetical protein